MRFITSTQRLAAGLLVMLLLPAASAGAATTPAEAARLKSDLTPFGAERAGNKDGTIPAWSGGYAGGSTEAFAHERPVLQITGKNMQEYADRLSEGTIALLKRFPDYRLDVYPTHRTAVAPQWVYDNTLRNATRARTANGGLAVEGAYGGVPFPLPQTGAEAMWNHMLAWRGESGLFKFSSYVVAGGEATLATSAVLDWQFPYYYRNGSPDEFSGVFELGKVSTYAPPFKAGEIFLLRDPVNMYSDNRKAWTYLVGQRRVRRAPMLSYDNPNSVTSGMSFVDEAALFNGSIDRYDWKLVGKKEMYVPYNTRRFHATPVARALGPNHLNPDYLRWELHRVWVVEASLAAGKRHVMPKRRFYLDEDTWLALLADGWDAHGQLWHVSLAPPLVEPAIPAVITYPYIIYDLVRGGYVGATLFNDSPGGFEVLPARPEAYFSPASLAGEGIR